MKSEVDRGALEDGGEGVVGYADEGFVGRDVIIVAIVSISVVSKTVQCCGREKGNGRMLSIVQNEIGRAG